MVILLSDDDDYSTLEIIKWLIFFNTDYIRINSSDEIHLIEMNLQNETFIIKIGSKIIDLFNAKMIWYRRGKLNFVGKDNLGEVSKFLKSETDVINQYLFKRFLLKKKAFIGNYLLSNPNKLLVLKYAMETGLKVPDTFISGDNIKVRNYLSSNNNNLITKSIGTTFRIEKDNSIFIGYTEDFFASDLTNFDTQFFPSLLQKKINKRFEVRSFFLIDTFFSMAIFSQSNRKTATDFRKYDDTLPNRTVPFSLPKSVQKKLLILLKKLQLNCASIDLIVDDNGEYIFLEVNPVGQFGMVSKPCNYYLEKKIAQKLSK